MVSAANTFEGGTNGTGITTGNSGGASGNAFDLVSTGTGATATFDNTNVMHGLLAAKLAIAGSATNCHLDWNSGTLTGGPFGQLWFRAYVMLPALPPSGNLGVLRARNSGSTLCGGIGITSTGQIITYDSGGTTRTTSVTKVVPGEYVRLEGWVIGSATAGQVQVSIFAANPDGTTPDEVNTTSGTLNTTGTIQQCICGNPSSLGNFTVWVDDFAVSTTGPLGPSVTAAANNTIPDEYWSWTPPLPSGAGFAAPISLQQPWLGIGTIGGSRFGVPQLRGQDYEIPFSSGQTWRSKWANSRTVTMVMWTAGIDQTAGTPGSGPNASQILAWNENFNTIRRSFYARGPNGSLQGKLTRRWLLNQGPVLVNTLFDQQVGGGTSNTPTQITPRAGDVIVVKGVSQASTDVIGTPTGGGLTYTLQGSVVNSGQTWTGIWTATVPASGDGIPFTVTATAATGSDLTVVVEQWRNCTVLAANTLTGFGSTSAPTLSPFVPLNGCATWAIGDTSVATGTPAYLNGGTEVVRDYSSAHYFSYFGNNAYITPASQAAGMTAPASQTWAMVVIVLQPTPTLVVATALAEVAGTMDPTMTGRTRSDFSTDLLLSDPYFYGDAQGQMLYPGVVNQMVNLGEAAVAEGKAQANNAWTAVLHGPLTTPIVITNSTLGVTFELADTIGSGHLVTVDFLNATAVDDLGNNLVGSVTHAGTRQWMMLATGTNSVELTSGSSSDTGYAALAWSPGYV